MAAYEPTRTEIEGIMRDALAKAFSERGGMVTKWVALVEAIGGIAGDDVALWEFASDELRSWDKEGMLSHALIVTGAQSVADALDGEDL